VSATVLIRVHFSCDMVEQLDKIAAQVCGAIGRNVSRAAVVRALVDVHVDTFTPALSKAVLADTVKRGRRAVEIKPGFSGVRREP
jgi:hypothetical protein